MDSDKNNLMQYDMLMEIYGDIRKAPFKCNSDNKESYETIFASGKALYQKIVTKFPDKASDLKRNLDYFDSQMKIQQKPVFMGLVEKGTLAGNQAAMLGTATGFIQRCPECTFPTQRCKC